MQRTTALPSTALAAALALWAGGAARAAEPEGLELPPGARLLVFAPHPDDESLGCGGLLQAALATGGSARVVTFTAGDGYVEAVQMDTGEPRPRPVEFVTYGEKRIGELVAATRVLGGGAIRVEVLGYPDGGLTPLLHAHWRHARPERSATTRQDEVPYVDAPDRGSPYTGADLIGHVVRALRESDPTVIALPDPLDEHPDHRATGLFALLGVAEWLHAPGREIRPDLPFPLVLAYVVHYPPWPPGWAPGTPPPPPNAESTPLDFPPRLPSRGYRRVLLHLTPEQVARKADALAQHETQQRVMAEYMRSFVRTTEPYSVLAGEDLDRLAEMIDRDVQRARIARERRR